MKINKETQFIDLNEEVDKTDLSLIFDVDGDELNKKFRDFLTKMFEKSVSLTEEGLRVELSVSNFAKELLQVFNLQELAFMVTTDAFTKAESFFEHTAKFIQQLHSDIDDEEEEFESGGGKIQSLIDKLLGK